MTRGRPKGKTNSEAAQFSRLAREAPIAQFLRARYLLKDERPVASTVRRFPGHTAYTVRRIGKRWGIEKPQTLWDRVQLEFRNPNMQLTVSGALAALEMIERQFSEQELRDMSDIGSDVAYRLAQKLAQKKSRTKK